MRRVYTGPYTIALTFSVFYILKDSPFQECSSFPIYNLTQLWRKRGKVQLQLEVLREIVKIHSETIYRR